LNGKDPDRRRGALSQPENHTPLQIFKEHMLTEIGSAAKSVSNRNLTGFYRLEPFHQRFVRSKMTKDDQR
jgi:hypothetical protein